MMTYVVHNVDQEVCIMNSPDDVVRGSVGGIILRPSLQMEQSANTSLVDEGWRQQNSEDTASVVHFSAHLVRFIYQCPLLQP